MTQPDFSSLNLAGGNDAQPLSEQLKRRRGRPSQYTPEQRAERAKKATQATALATGVLKQRHEAEYLELLNQAKQEMGL